MGPFWLGCPKIIKKGIKMSIYISKKYGVNPSMVKCWFCGEIKEIALLGKFKGEDRKAPREIYLDKEPCDKCKEYMKEGVIFLEVANDNPEYRMGGFVEIKDKSIPNIINNKEMLQSVLNKRCCLMATEAFQNIFGEYLKK